MVEAIQVKISARDPERESSENLRREFWNVVRQHTDKEQTDSKCEAILVRQFGSNLKSRLIDQLSEPIKQLRRKLFRDDFYEFERLIFRKESRDDYPSFEIIGRLIEQRQKWLSENPNLETLQKKLSAASSIHFDVKIRSYSSLNLDISVSGLEALGYIFDGNISDFEIFLSVYIPGAFSWIFNEDAADEFNFDVRVPESFSAPFGEGISYPNSREISPSQHQLPPPVQTGKGIKNQMNNMEFFWKTANLTLLVPIALSIGVLYLAYDMVTEINVQRNQLLEPILDHHVKLLEEDRKRLIIPKSPAND